MKEYPLCEDFIQKRHSCKHSQRTDCGPTLLTDLLCPGLMCSCLATLFPEPLLLSFTREWLIFTLFFFPRPSPTRLQLISPPLNVSSHVMLPSQLQGNEGPNICPLAHLPLTHCSLQSASARSVSRQRELK